MDKSKNLLMTGMAIALEQANELAEIPGMVYNGPRTSRRKKTTKTEKHAKKKRRRIASASRKANRK